MWPFDKKKGVDSQQNQETIDKTNLYLAQLKFLYDSLYTRLLKGVEEPDIVNEKKRLQKIFENISKLPNFQNNEELKNAFNKQVALVDSYESSLELKNRIKSLGSRAKSIVTHISMHSQMTNENKQKFENDCREVLQIASNLHREINNDSNKNILRFVEKNFKDINYDLTSIDIFLKRLNSRA